MIVTVYQMREYLKICGFTEHAKQGDFEQWVRDDMAVQLCVSENIVPDFSINSILRDLNEDHIKFMGIISIIK